MAVILNKGRITSTPSIPFDTSYERPSDWTDLPSLSQGDEKVYLLVNVSEFDGSNYMRLKFKGDYTVDWGDGTSPTNHTSNTDADHEFLWANAPSSSLTSQGFRQVIVTVTPQAGSQLTEWLISTSPYVPSGITSNGKINFCVCRVKMAGTNFVSLKQAMYLYTGLQEFEYVGTNNITNFNYTFSYSGLRKLTALDTSSGTNFSYMFGYCNEFSELSALDMSSATNCSYMFISNLGIVKLPTMAIPNCTNLQYCFYNCNQLEEIPFTSFDSVSNFFGAFVGPRIREFNHSIPSATNCKQMFHNCQLLQTAVLRDIPVGQLTDTSFMFSGNYSLTYIKPFDTSGVTVFRDMFNTLDCDMDLSWVDTSNGVNFENFLKNCTNIKDLSWVNVTSSATMVNSIFDGCFSATKFPTSMDLTNVTSLQFTFRYCHRLKEPITLTNSGNITAMYATFENCYSLETAPSFSGNQFTTIRAIYKGCKSLAVIPNYDTSLITNFPNSYQAFQNCTNLRKSLITSTSSQISYASCALNRAEIVNIFNNLQTSTDNRTIYVNNNPGSGDLTASDLLIATNKGWTVSS